MTGSGAAPAGPGWLSPARQDAALAARIGEAAGAVEGVAAIPPSGLPPVRRDEALAPHVRIADDHVEVHLVAGYGEPVQVVADRLAVALAPLLAGRELRVAVDDILLPGENLTDYAQQATTGDDERS